MLVTKKVAVKISEKKYVRTLAKKYNAQVHIQGKYEVILVSSKRMRNFCI